ncbi:zinc transport system substrate-binding protein [Candidatus Hakubella thermalkaliphila]|uniref:Zinc transport system substrate-binding protein n=1 Tax=Candidatus Hakubella thermalkaliphila TaxID=2754717 RepID=A0A6V8NII1_9ACTN|nr:zinc ABC transporter substrate-binding protein [Candidatus Hakubella thermalkaliphila]GFP19171.1 zinc transport system substrate-binding protein [Candidatus Hakubella thermalkaliphila]GFP22587.1 zinc transport system substrate-binding protein [Candidatus Hakubella thermalkaliphila]GFP29299.1 zinc transport system substrate-binding protein [Candidatus Hakubella thermalkaliphila]GFP38318.1 zinc transport system substrate-binding protein [Candidatus Hakubella thermalkaliphila]
MQANVRKKCETRSKWIILAMAGLLSLALSLTACAPAPAAPEPAEPAPAVEAPTPTEPAQQLSGRLDKIKVATTVYPLAEFVKAVGKERVEVSSLIPPGTEPHEFTPTPQDRVTIEQSQLFVFVGAGFEPWADRILPDLKMATVQASTGLSLLPAIVGHEHEHGHEDEANEEHLFDPHILADPVLVQEIVNNITQKLSEIDPANTSFYQNNATSYKRKLIDLDNRFKAGLASCQRRDFITSHAAFAYLAKRYNLTQIPIAGIFEEDPSPAKLAEIVELIKEKNINYIFMERLIGNPKLTETIAKETGAKTLVLNPPEDITTEDIENGRDYFSLMTENLENLRLALECQ